MGSESDISGSAVSSLSASAHKRSGRGEIFSMTLLTLAFCGSMAVCYILYKKLKNLQTEMSNLKSSDTQLTELDVAELSRLELQKLLQQPVPAPQEPAPAPRPIRISNLHQNKQKNPPARIVEAEIESSDEEDQEEPQQADPIMQLMFKQMGTPVDATATKTTIKEVVEPPMEADKMRVDEAMVEHSKPIIEMAIEEAAEQPAELAEEPAAESEEESAAQPALESALESALSSAHLLEAVSPVPEVKEIDFKVEKTVKKRVTKKKVDTVSS